MGGALARGLLDSGLYNPENISISEPEQEKLTDLKEMGVKIYTSNTEDLKTAGLIVIAVKPWVVKDIISEILLSIDKRKQELCFIVAGIPSEKLSEMFGEFIPEKVSIAIPNTAMVKRESMTFMVSVRGKDFEAEKIFNLVGKVLVIEERLLPAATALASCGIAFAMRYVRASCEGGVELGFRASQAQEIVVQTLKGVFSLLSEKGSHPEMEIDKVTTPGGITIKGLNAMERNGFTNSVIEGLKAAR